MKKLFISLFLLVSSLAVSSQDYKWYQGRKIMLERGSRKYIIYEDGLLNESDKSKIAYSVEDVFYDGIPNLKWGYTRAHVNIEDTAHVHYCTIAYRKDGDYYDNMFLTHQFYVKLKSDEDITTLDSLAAETGAEIVEHTDLWYVLRCKLDAPQNALDLANLFYETGLFAAAEPEMINIFASAKGPSQLKSLCDEWNVIDENNIIHKYRLKDGQVIENSCYANIYKDGVLEGRLREDESHDIYYTPVINSHEYLLYSFNPQKIYENQTFSNLWVGGNDTTVFSSMYPNGWIMDIVKIEETTPRTIWLSYGDPSSVCTYPFFPLTIKWLEGVGFPEGPLSAISSERVLCAYKNDELVYVSELGEKYGCGENISESQQLFMGEWKLDQVTVSGPHYLESGQLVNEPTTYTMNDSLCEVKMSIYERELLWGSCENPYPEYPAPTYTFQEQEDETWLVTVTHRDHDFWETKEYTIRTLTKYALEWEYKKYILGDDKEPTVYRESFRRLNYEDSSDTIQLYIKDNPGSSTVDPADPNLIYAVLEGEMLIIRDYTGAEIYLSLTNNGSSSNRAPARRSQSQSFTDSTSVELTENGQYDIELTSDLWDYMVFGSFDFNKIRDAVELMPSERPAASKIFHNGLLFIRQGDRLYTPSGIQVQ